MGFFMAQEIANLYMGPFIHTWNNPLNYIKVWWCYIDGIFQVQAFYEWLKCPCCGESEANK